MYNGAFPYIASYLNPTIITRQDELKIADTILYSWTYSWQDIGWLSETANPVIVGGKHLEMLHQNHVLPELGTNIIASTGALDAGEHQDFNVVPDYSVTLRYNPYVSYLMVYSGDGCYWKRCTFCKIAHDYPHIKYKQFDPSYVASVIRLANSYGKVAGLSCDCHTVRWLVDLESYLPNDCMYDSYCRADQEGWSRLRKVGTIFIGTDYLSESVLKRVDKGIGVEQLLSTIWEIQSLGINVETMFINDLWQQPDEREEHYQNTIRLLSTSRRLKGKLTIIENKFLPLWKMCYVLRNGKYLDCK